MICNFRQVKDGIELPRFFNAKFRNIGKLKYKKFKGDLGYIEYYHFFVYFMLKTLFRGIHGGKK